MAASCEQVRSAVVDPARVRGLQLLLAPESAPFALGEPLPPLWHWVALADWLDPCTTGSDGHPSRPAALEGTPRRRMFAGGEIVFGSAPLRVGQDCRISTSLTHIEEKSGRTGTFVLATFNSTVTDEGDNILITERQDIAYTPVRESDLDAPAGPLPIVGRPLAADADSSGLVLRTDPTILVRFSALTANAHRIHYDLAYAREIEGLPGLLVHGPFINLALAGLVGPGGHVHRIEHRNLSPLFAGQIATLSAHQARGVVTAEATAPDARAISRVILHLDEHQEGRP